MRIRMRMILKEDGVLRAEGDVLCFGENRASGGRSSLRLSREMKSSRFGTTWIVTA